MDSLGTDTAKLKLTMAGYRGQQAEIAFLFFRLVVPIGFFVASSFYLFVLKVLDRPPLILVGIVIACVLAGVKAPECFFRSHLERRRRSARRGRTLSIFSSSASIPACPSRRPSGG